MNRLIIFILALIFLNNCSLKENNPVWKNKEKEIIAKKNIKKISQNNKYQLIVNELNPQLKLDLNKIKTKNRMIDNKNDYGSQDYEGLLDETGKYKFSKFKKIDHLNYKPIFLNNGLIFFDKNGSIIRYDVNKKVLWKNNYYSKNEKKLNPKLYFSLDNENLLVVDNIAKYYSFNINSGKLNWSKNNIYPFNSEIKKDGNKFFAIDYNNTLRCYYIIDGSECWNLQTEDSFTISDSKFSLIIIDKMVIFNNSIGDITAIDIETGLIIWQLPTQNSDIINETFSFKTSKLVSDGVSIFFSNNRNEFYSVDAKTGLTNWINKINSNIRPIILDNLIITISNNGFLYTIDKDSGNIIKINNLLKNYKKNKRKNIIPIGFVIGKTNLYLMNNNSEMTIVNLSLGNIIKTEKVSGNFTSEPFIFNNNLFVIRNGSIIQYN